jgi:hypothetical protein
LSKRSNDLAFRLGQELGSNFLSIDEGLKEKVWKSVEENPRICEGFAEGLGQDISFLDKRTFYKILEIARTNNRFAFYLVSGFGKTYTAHPKGVRLQMLSLAKQSKKLLAGLGNGLFLHFVFDSPNKDQQQEIIELITLNNNLAYRIGNGLGAGFRERSTELQRVCWQLAKENDDFAEGFGMQFGYEFSELPKSIQRRAWEFFDENKAFAQGLGFGLGNNFTSMNEEIQNRVWRLAKENGDFAIQLAKGGLGYNLESLDEKFEEVLVELAKKNTKFAAELRPDFSSLSEKSVNELIGLAEINAEVAGTLGEGAAQNFSSLNEEVQNKVVTFARNNIAFARSLAEGLTGKNLSELKNSTTLAKIFELVRSSKAFAEYFASRVGLLSNSLTDEIWRYVLEESKKNSVFSSGLGYGLGIYFPSDNDLREKILDMANQDPFLASSLGRGMGSYFIALSTKLEQEKSHETDGHLRAGGLTDQLSYDEAYDSTILADKLDEYAGTVSNLYTSSMELGYSLGYEFDSLDEIMQTKILQIAIEYEFFCMGFGLGIAHFHNKPDLLFDALEKITNKMTNEHTRDALAFNLGISLGFSYSDLNEETQVAIYQKIIEEKNSSFMNGITAWDRSIIL